MLLRRRSRDFASVDLLAARDRAMAIAATKAYAGFVETVRDESPWRFNGAKELDRYLRNVDHHLLNFVPEVLACLDDDVRTVFDFGCGSGSGSIALAMVLPEVRCHGVDIDPAEVAIGRARAKLYGVDDKCHFECIKAEQALPVSSGVFDLCVCCSVLEYVTNMEVRKLCVQEMTRSIAPGGLLFVTVPNRFYPVELHSRKLGWNYFPGLLKARIVGSSMWEVKRLAKPYVLKPHHTPLRKLLAPWTNFCLKKDDPTAQAERVNPQTLASC